MWSMKTLPIYTADKYNSIIYVHGIADKENPAIVDQEQISKELGVPVEKVTIFHYEDLMDESRVSRWSMMATWTAAQYIRFRFGVDVYQTLSALGDKISDAVIYLNPLFKTTRNKIQARFGAMLKALLEANDKVLVIGFSLGAVIAREGMDSTPWPEGLGLVTMGNPQAHPLVDKLSIVSRGLSLPSWWNIYSILDPVSPKKIAADLGCSVSHQFSTKSPHSRKDYLEHLKNCLKVLGE